MSRYSNKAKWLIVSFLSVIFLMSCGGDGSDGDSYFEPVSSVHNPPIASLNDVLAAPSSEETTFQPLLSEVSARFETYCSDSERDPYAEGRVSDIAAYQIDVQGGFSGFSISLGTGAGYFTTNYSDSADGRFRTFSKAYSELNVLIPGPNASELEFTSFVVAWDSIFSCGCILGFCGSGDLIIDTTSYTFGLMTPDGNIPQSGIANFSGTMAGTFISQNSPLGLLTGNVDLQVDFDNNVVSGSLNNIVGNISPFPDIALSGAFIANQVSVGNQVSGTAVNVSIGTVPNMNGDFVMRLFGPNSEEIGGVLVLSTGDEAIIGAIAAKR